MAADVSSVSYNRADDILAQNVMLSIDYEIKKENRYKRGPQAEQYK